MRQSKLFTKTFKKDPKGENSVNAKLLIRAGFVHKEISGVYSFLPLGLRVIEKIKNIIREELNSIGGQEIKMSALQKKDPWEKTGRWDDKNVDDWFKTKLKNKMELGLAFTHEEPLAALMKNFIFSYKDLPSYPYQFQTKFRNELRAKSGIMRGREFIMKDLYDFSLNEKEHNIFYEKVKNAYMNIFNRAGIGEKTYTTISSGGSFSKYSFEFQTISKAGEDVIIYDEKNKIAINKSDYSEEIFKDFKIKKENFNFKEAKSIEVGDIYSLGYKYSKAMGLTYKNKEGKDQYVYMGSYGIGIPRLMGTIVEMYYDEKGIIWPEEVSPFKIHLIRISKDENIKKIADEIYKDNKEDIFYDDRDDKQIGERLAEADLIGISNRIIISEKTIKKGGVEIKKRNEELLKIIKIKEIKRYLK